jgi:hypothetical protein
MLHVGFLFMLNDELAGQAVSDIYRTDTYTSIYIRVYRLTLRLYGLTESSML